MAYIDPSDPNNQQAQMAPNALLQTPQTAGQVSSGPAGGVASAVPPAGVAAQTGGGKAPPVQNLSAYLKANAPQAQGMADKIATTLGAGAKQVQSDMANAQSAFDTEVQTGSVQPDQGLIQQAAADPVNFVKDPNNVQAFQKQLNASYTGPQDFQGTKYYSDLNSKISSAVANAGSTDPKNIRQVVQKLETNPTAGMTALDALVLQQNPNAIGTVKSAQAPYATLNQALSDMVTQSNAKIQAAQSGTSAAPQAVKSVFDPMAQNFKATLMNQLQNAASKQAINSSTYNSLLTNIQSGNYAAITPSQYAALGVDPSQFQGISNANSVIGNNFPGLAPNFAAYINPGGNKSISPIMENVAGTNDFDMDAALATLLGNGYSSSLNQSLRNQAGTYKEDIQNPTFNQDAMMDAMIDAILGKTTFNNYSSDPIGKELTALGLAKGFSTGQQAGQVNYLDPQTIASIDALLGISGYSKVPLF